MASLPASRENALRHSMKKRLSLWDSFFSKVQNELVNSAGNESGSEEFDETCLEDPKLLSVNEEHNNIRRSIRIEHGINEESEISESEAECVCENSDQATDIDNLAGEAADGDQHGGNRDSESAIRQKKELSKNHKSPGAGRVGIRRKSDVNPKHQETKSKAVDKILVSPSKSRIDFKGNGGRKSNDDAVIRKDKLKEKSETSATTAEACSELKIRTGRVVAEIRTSRDKKQERPPNSYECSTPIEKCQEKRPLLMLPLITPILKNKEVTRFNFPVENSDSRISPKTQRVPDKPTKNKESPSVLVQAPEVKKRPEISKAAELHQTKTIINNKAQTENKCLEKDVQQPSSPQTTSPDPVLTASQSRKLNIKKMCKQYDLWKLHEKRKSGKLGSLHIVSDLNEDLLDTNRYVHDTPPVAKNPFKTPRRFTLQKHF